MSDNVINLRQARKRNARAVKEQHAAENRRKHGRTKAERQKEEREATRATDALAGHRLEDNNGQVRSDDDDA